PLGAFARDRLDADARRRRETNLLYAELLLQKLDQLLGLGRLGLPLDAGVDVLGVLAKDHHVHLLRALDRRRHTGEVAHRAQADVEIEELAQGDVERADAATDRRGQRPLDTDAILLERFDGLVGQPASGLLERLLAGEHFLPLHLALAFVCFFNSGVEHAHRGAPDVAAGPITFAEGADGAGRGRDGAVRRALR